MSRFLRSVLPTAGMWRRLRNAPLPADTLFTPLDYLPEVPWTGRQRRAVLVIANTGPLFFYVNSAEGIDYRKDVLDAQRRHQLMPVPEIPLGAREHVGPDGKVVPCDPAWNDCYLAACLARKGRLRLYPATCGCFVFADPGARPRCPVHDAARLRVDHHLRNLVELVFQCDRQ